MVRLGRILLLTMVLAAIVPFFHVDHHPGSDCAVCVFHIVGGFGELPEPPQLGDPGTALRGLTPDPALAILIGCPHRPGSRAPPTSL